MAILESKIYGVSIKSSSLDKTSNCSSAIIKDSKKYYDDAIKFLNKNDKVISMVKDYYSFWIPFVSAIRPNDGELEHLYSQRIANDERKIEEMSNRIKLELDL